MMSNQGQVHIKWPLSYAREVGIYFVPHLVIFAWPHILVTMDKHFVTI